MGRVHENHVRLGLAAQESKLPDPLSDFTEQELELLQGFYSGVRASALREMFKMEPWAVVLKFRGLPSGVFESVLSHWRQNDIK